MALCPPSGEPIAHGLPGSFGLALAELFFPFRCVTPMGWIGGRYKTSNPMEAMYGRRSSQSLNVPCPPLLEHDLGNISYQALNLAFSRSTTTMSALSYCVAKRRSGYFAIKAAISMSRACSMRPNSGTSDD